MLSLLHAVSSEWLKRRRSLTTWLVVGSATFVPAVMFAARLRHPANLAAIYGDPKFWDILFVQAWESMALMILPLATMLIVSLVTQIEDRNSGWKQLHAAPLPLSTIFLSKLVVILVLVTGIVVLHNFAIYLVGVLPALLLPGLTVHAATFPALAQLARAAVFLVDVLPVVGIQYLLALRLRTFVAPLAIGMALWILSLGLMSWQYSYLLPYTYPSLDYLRVEYHRNLPLPSAPSTIAVLVFLAATAAGAMVFSLRKNKG